MRRIAIAALTGVVLLSGRGLGQTNVFDDAAAELTAEWQYPQGLSRCMEALRFFSETGAADPTTNAEAALIQLSLGEPLLSALYADAQRIDRCRFRCLLASAASVVVKKGDTLNSKLALDFAATTIQNAILYDRGGLGLNVNQQYKNNPERALYGLLNEVRTVLAGRIQAADYAKKGAEAIKTAEDVAAMAAAAAKNAPQNLLNGTKKARNLSTKLTNDQEALKNAEDRLKKVNTNPKSTAAEKDAAIAMDRKASGDISDDEIALDLANDDVKKAEDAVSGASQASETAAAAVETARKLVALTLENDPMKLQANLMEIYRICYGTDQAGLFKIVAGYYPEPTHPSNP